MLFISSCIFEFPSGKVSLLFLFIQKFIDLTFILSEFFHSIEDFRLAFWSCYSITFKTTILFYSKKSPASDHCCSQDNLFFLIQLHLAFYYIFLSIIFPIYSFSQQSYLNQNELTCVFYILLLIFSFDLFMFFLGMFFWPIY